MLSDQVEHMSSISNGIDSIDSGKYFLRCFDRHLVQLTITKVL
jgi:hypothetical protein